MYRRVLLLAIAVAGCDRLAGIPEPTDPIDAATPDAPDLEPACDGVDDDADGLIDEGYQYTEPAGAFRVLDAGAYAGLWWMASDGTHVAASWATGDGNAGDVVSAQVFDLDGAPVGAAVTTMLDQPWTVSRGFWSGDRYAISATQRTYACGGDTSTDCATYLMALDTSGQQILAPTMLVRDTPAISGAYVDRDQYFVALVPGGGVGAIRLRSYALDGSAGDIDLELFATAPGESVATGTVRTVRGVDRIYWTYVSSTTGFTLRVTDLSGQTMLGPVTLDEAALGAPTRGSDHGLIVDGMLVLVYARPGGGVEVGWWTAQGERVRTAELPGAQIPFSIALGGEQIFVLASDVSPGPAELWRLSLDGRIAQRGATVFPESPHSAAAVAGPLGVIVAGAVYGAGSHPVMLTRMQCP
jgi:hypothetical protein